MESENAPLSGPSQSSSVFLCVMFIVGFEPYNIKFARERAPAVAPVCHLQGVGPFSMTKRISGSPGSDRVFIYRSFRA